MRKQPLCFILSTVAVIPLVVMLTQCQEMIQDAQAIHSSIAASKSNAPLAAATTAEPYVNSLGMKFVPIPGTKILLSTTEVTIAQYIAAGGSYKPAVYPQGPDHPVVNVSWTQANQWCYKAGRKDKVRYRLPTKDEWTRAAGGGLYPWGVAWPPPPGSGNLLGQEAKTDEIRGVMLASGAESVAVIGGYQDQHVFTAPVGSFPANQYGLLDMGGNVFEWLQDIVPDEYVVKNAYIGAAWTSGVFQDGLLSSARGWPQNDGRYDLGFRVAIVVK